MLLLQRIQRNSQPHKSTREHKNRLRIHKKMETECVQQGSDQHGSNQTLGISFTGAETDPDSSPKHIKILSRN